MGEKNIQEDLWKNFTKLKQYMHSKAGIGRSKWLAKHMEDMQFSSVFEIGSCVGRNLEYISKAFPNVKIGGLDINGLAIEYAKKKLPNAIFYNTSIYDMPKDKWDVVFTMGVLIHIPPDGIDAVVKRCIEKANKYIIHVERQGDGEVLTGPEHLGPKKIAKKFHWAPNIKKIYNDFGYKAIVKEVPESLSTGGATHIICVEV